ncbi:MAG: hypothetical protein IH940_02785 [Acidobacteria bacterium]|nr:hypothetical protein [Acidobacteriota bacterium]
MKTRNHPSDEQLRDWLAEDVSASVTAHIERCEACLDRVEGLSDLGDALVGSLKDEWSAPMGIEQRTSSGIESRMRREEAMFGFLDLFAIGGDVFRTVLDDSEDFDD